MKLMLILLIVRIIVSMASTQFVWDPSCERYYHNDHDNHYNDHDNDCNGHDNDCNDHDNDCNDHDNDNDASYERPSNPSQNIGRPNAKYPIIDLSNSYPRRRYRRSREFCFQLLRQSPPVYNPNQGYYSNQVVLPYQGYNPYPVYYPTPAYNPIPVYPVYPNNVYQNDILSILRNVGI